MKEKNLDARGHRTLGLFGMKVYYRGDPDSLAVLRRYPSNRMVIVPHITIELDLENPVAVRVHIVYPLEQVTTEVLITADQIEELRDIYHYPRPGWESKRWGNKVYLTSRGRLCPADEAPSPIVPLVGEGY